MDSRARSGGEGWIGAFGGFGGPRCQHHVQNTNKQMDSLASASNNHTPYLRNDNDPVTNLMSYTAADFARFGQRAVNPLKKIKVDSIFIPKHAQAKPMRGFGVPNSSGIVKNVSVRHPGVIGWVRRAPKAPPPVVVVSASK